VVFGAGGHLRLVWLGWSWFIARLSICPLENYPVLLESITAPVEEMAITIYDGGERERESGSIHCWNIIRNYDWNIFIQSTTTQMSCFQVLSSLHFLLLFFYCQIVSGGCSFNPPVTLGSI